MWYSFVYVIGGLALMFAPFERKRRRSRWALGLLVTAGGLLLVKGAVEYLLYHSAWMPAPALQRGLPGTLHFIGGMAAGILIALAVSGELIGQKPPESAKPL